MTPPIATVIRVAATPEQAKVLAALLRAEGVPAYVDGDSLADEVAMSRRLMNLQGTRVMVPTASLERAREILAEAVVAPDDLEQQALAADDPEREPVGRTSSPAPRPVWPLVVATAAAGLFAVLWLDERSRRQDGETPHPFFDFVLEPGVLKQVRRSDGRLVVLHHDDDLDLAFDRWDTLGPDGDVLTSVFDEDHDGYVERVVEVDDGWTSTWTDVDRDGVVDACVVRDANGAVVQRLARKRGLGFVIEKQ